MPEDGATEPLPDAGWRNTPRRRTLLAAAVLVVVVALAVAAWFLFAHKTSHYTDQQTAQAKTNVCKAYSAVRQGIVINTHLGLDDPSGRLAVASNARLALLGGGLYLRDRLATEPATPADLAKAANSMADTVEQLGVNYLAGADNLQDPLRHDLDSEIQQINGLCQ